ncbi:5 -3 exoribonuclease 2 [Pyrrhoderma noxium]|uniref:5'-3' exoribonuclease n=1 Tax=Pyrrhoderma noxium TaxID=2282107 RepID=A0A286ULT8_9AGAM|nr:5 -3 exoribonuclease 2 [Pyrrhoderma noxium]
MGVPALFRWLSKKYPKIVLPVVEDEETVIQDDEGNSTTIPILYKTPNPNEVEFDNLYLDMNGIVHPCTHPEGKPAPETEEEMMVEVFKYTERVVNMVRPRKLLFMAIDGVAPRAKMNQQRSRRFRAAREAQEKHEAKLESIQLWKSMGKEVPPEMSSERKAWDSNAITPGTPFMDLLARSLRYWVVQKMNSDPGWKDLEVIISDAGVPGEGEHKIMDFIRRQRSNPGHNPNTQHVIYGLDADLIMLALATHEPHFRVLREDVFAQDSKPNTCRICGQTGHFAAQCTGKKAEVDSTKESKKPFIFLDVSILREYLEIELDVPNCPFPFDIERAIDDWVMLIFFVGNDFLPHLPSLEIREGAIDTLLRIWKNELPRMGGFMTNNGILELAQLEVILKGLASREDEIFRRRREVEERQEQNAKRRKMELSKDGGGLDMANVKPSASLQLTAVPTAPPSLASPHGLPAKPNFDSFVDSTTTLGLGSLATEVSDAKVAAAVAMLGSKEDVVANRRRLRNLSAAEMLKAEMMSAVPANPLARKKYEMEQRAARAQAAVVAEATPASDSAEIEVDASNEVTQVEEPTGNEGTNGFETEQMAVDSSPRGVKRKAGELAADGDGDGEAEEDIVLSSEEDEEASASTAVPALKVNADGTVEQEDTVKLWERGYKERYYRQKFGAEPSDVEFRKKVTQAYVEGISWVLHYYYQGTPSWHWYYPYHFAPFAADFSDMNEMKVNFSLGEPFKPFEQLMGVFPASSRTHIPETFHELMTNQDSPIIDFYPESFEIDMNGKKMAWQGVALLPFIDEERLLDAMNTRYPGLTEAEIERNKWGNNVLFVADEHPLYPTMETLYAKSKPDKPILVSPEFGKGLNGSLLPDPTCLPGSTYESPLKLEDLRDIPGDCSLSALYFFPKQLTPHRSILLPGVRRPKRVLTTEDVNTIKNGRRGGRGEGFHSINAGGRGGGGGDWGQRGGSQGYRGNSYGGYGQGGGYGNQNGYNGGQGYGGYGVGTGRGGYGSTPGRGGYSNGGRYGGPPPRTNDYSRPGNTYNQNGTNSYGGYGGGAPYNNQRQTYRGTTQYNNYGGYGSQGQGQGYGGGGGYGGYGGGSYGGTGGRGGHNVHNSNGGRGGYAGGHTAYDNQNRGGYSGYGNAYGAAPTRR